MTDIKPPELTNSAVTPKAAAQADVVVTEAEAKTIPDAIKARVEAQAVRAQAVRDAAVARQDQAQTSKNTAKPTPERTAETVRQVRAEGRVVERLDNGDYVVRTREGDVVLRPQQAAETPRAQVPVRVDFPPQIDNGEAVIVQVTVRPSQLDGEALRTTATPLDVAIAAPALAPPVSEVLPAIPVRLEALPADFVLPPYQPAVQNFTISTADFPVLTPLVTGPDTSPALTSKAQILTPIAYSGLADLAALRITPPAVPAHIAQHLVQPDSILAEPAPLTLGGARVSIQTNFTPPPITALPTATVDTTLPLQTPPAGLLQATAAVDTGAGNLVLAPIKAGDVPLVITGQKHNGAPIVRAQAHQAVQPQASLHALNQVADAAQGTPSQLFLLHGLTFDQAAGQIVRVSPQGIATADIAQAAPLPVIPAGIPAAVALTPYFLTTESWPVMDALQQDLARISPQTAQSFGAMIPSPSANPGQMMPAIMFFMAAIRSGDMASWLGEKASTLLKAASDGKALSRLTGEGELLSRLATERPSAEWRSLPLPFYHDDQFRKVLLHVREEMAEHDANQQKGKNVRFIFDLALDNMGDVQLDGLFHGSGRMDLIVRTEQHFSQAMHQEMRRVYAGAVEQAGVHGELSFQNALQQWVTVNHQAKAFGVNT